MKKQFLNFKILVLVVIIAALSACSLQNRLAGTWEITSYSEKNVNGSNANSENIGTIEFNKDGTGINNLEYKLMGTTKADNSNFNYTVGDKFVTINSDDANALAKSWIVVENKRTSQKWKSTEDGAVQILELKKK